MILTNRLFERKAPSRNAKSIYIFCEGFRREYDYFKYFKEKDSRINIEVHKLSPNDDNSPLGLYNIANQSFSNSENVDAKFNLEEGDEVWIVLDTDPDKGDSRVDQISQIREYCSKKNKWFVTESNPCFEVWLYYHKYENLELIDVVPNICNDWKSLVNNSIIGGFDSRKHPIFIQDATINSERAHINNDNKLDKGQTEVYNLGKSILNILEEKINLIKNKL